VWAVNQQATCDLMGQMHYWLAQGETTAAALRRARQALAASVNYAHPHYWAGFAVFGGRDGPGTRTVWMAAGLGLVLLVGAAWWWRARKRARSAARAV
jgi:hypothetical protein